MSGNVASTVELDPWGGETNRSTNEGFQPRKFNTYLRDAIASDDAMHRRYNRWWSRFEQPDPYDGSYNLGDPQTFNRYSYVKNDPVNLVDPTGLEDMPVGPCPPGNPCEVPVWVGGGADDPRFYPSTGGPVETGGVRSLEPIPRGGDRGDRPEPDSTVREIPCNPTADQLAENKQVKEIMGEVFKYSGYGTPYAHEEGAFIFADSKNRLTMIPMRSGTDQDLPGSLQIPASPFNDLRLVGTIHSHPFTKGNPIPSTHVPGGGPAAVYGPQAQPSQFDLDYSAEHGNLPGIIVTQVGDKRFAIPYSSGPGPNNPCSKF